MAKARTIEVFITSLKIANEDNWLKDWIKKNGAEIKNSPLYLYLLGDYEPVQEWCRFRNLPSYYMTQKLMQILSSIIWEGQKESILIYENMTINTGHKRVACLLFLKRKSIKAQVVPDNYKL